VAIVAALVWIAAVSVTRKAVIASIAMLAVVVLAIAVARRPAWEVATFAGVAVVIVMRHSGNLARLRQGQEPSFNPTAEKIEDIQ
jgi:glycerol-3-phosphate acyltransferase PlsY